MRRILRAALAALVTVVAVGAAYELAVAVGVIGLGPLPGQGPPGDTPVVEVSLLALLLTGALLLLAAPLSRGVLGAWGRVSVPIAGVVAAAFLVARFYSNDPYYAPQLQRMSDGGVVAGRWVALLVVATIAAGMLVRRWPRVGLAASALGVWAIAVTAAVAGTGH